ncbi:MAG: tRNA (guanine(10)-N(2))-dimethyltransferase [Candidatus Bathyarchaeota archaeon]|nr:MAG: tRNA (guanine(10)-N(2))-dimethyltransferase [Candidatus Bathyarchaeota archaeon]
MDYLKILVQERSASFYVPEITRLEGESLERTRSHAAVFYNPRMKLNRDSAVLALNALGKILSRPIRACEPMCGTGIRGIRLALEVGDVDRVVLGDLNPSAVKLAEENARMNGVSAKVSVRLIEANLLLSLHAKPLNRFDYVDIDPYGTPSPYIDSAVRACKKDGMVALTATDMAPLCGVNQKACVRKYGGRPLRTEYCHEQALRLVAGAFVTRSAIHEVATRPVFSYASDHYVRVYFMLTSGKKRVDSGLGQMGYILHCFGCSNRKVVSTRIHSDEVCDHCGSMMRAAGPLWIGELAEASFCDEMLDVSERSAISSNRRLIQIIGMVGDEIGLPPGFYNIDKVSSKLRIPSVPITQVLGTLREAGFRAVGTHIDGRGLKTNAAIQDIDNVVLKISRGR